MQKRILKTSSKFRLALYLQFICCVFLFANSAHANASVCYLGMTDSNPRATSVGANIHAAYYLNGGYRFYTTSELSCHDVHEIETGIATVVFSLSIGEAVATASGVGVPVTAGLAISAAGLSYANFWVSGITCDEDPAKIQKRIQDSICSAFADSPDVICDPNSLKILVANSSDFICKQ